jgi:hypothetical protein
MASAIVDAQTSIHPTFPKPEGEELRQLRIAKAAEEEIAAEGLGKTQS